MANTLNRPTNPGSKSTVRRGAFTLIELLVAIAIIAVLIAILLPQFTGAREAARRVKCAANMKNMFWATTYYADDNKEWFGGVWNAGAEHELMVAIGVRREPDDLVKHALYPGLRYRGLEWSYQRAATWDTLPASAALDQFYGANPGVRMCPSVRHSGPYAHTRGAAGSPGPDGIPCTGSGDPSCNDDGLPHPGGTAGKAMTDYPSWYGRAVGGVGGKIGPEHMPDTPYYFIREGLTRLNGTNMMGWGHASGGSAYGMVWANYLGREFPELPRYAPGERFGPTWNRLIERNRNTVLSMDRHRVYTQADKDADRSPGGTSNHVISRNKGGMLADGANATVIDGSVEWHSFKAGDTVWLLGAAGQENFWVSREKNHPIGMEASGYGGGFPASTTVLKPGH